ncbi:hypothetical protein O6H91_03G107600 [Diphasiastrum complanatum]|uniref:Uncharacterized protein n=2 Tax=Diphasiastrum complanatum TaxID=34168 RepID=A0ACC2EA45_DIPCM|nr:hypothetical protein O6H91_03G107600 [Diphasiastrum complanatum]KAJ7563375.1 hypothetical protein O6H91_03G107600 [Diphasiastrum complanatum]
MAIAEAPAFQEAAHCAVCNCSFGTFRRRHHCRCCGKSFCNEHSSNQMDLPQFGLHSPVRVCDQCFCSSKEAILNIPSEDLQAAVESTASSISRLDVASKTSSSEKDVLFTPLLSPAFECKCGMPLCICEPPIQPKVAPAVHESAVHLKPKKSAAAPVSSSVQASKSSNNSGTGNMPSLFFSGRQTTHGNTQRVSKSYEATGEGLREAIKNGDEAAVKDLLMRGIDANYLDKQGMSLLHLAAVFNFTEIAFLLMDAGANAFIKNAQGETPLECAQPTLQHKMRLKLQTLSSSE